MVACHKACDIYDKGIYTPIQVGKAISKYDLGFLGDDTGDNISAKNPAYCELTAQYWAWKNLKCKYIGLCHYRRYFETVYTEHSLDAVFSRYDVILPKPIYYGIRETMLHKLRMNILPEDCAIFLLSIRKLYPEYYNPQIQIFAESETKRPFFKCSFKTKRTKKDLRTTQTIKPEIRAKITLFRVWLCQAQFNRQYNSIQMMFKQPY